MKKNFYYVLAIILFLTFTLAFCGYTLYQMSDGYVFSDDFYNISVTFYEDSSKSRAFHFFADNEKYRNNCHVQLDPAEHNEYKPSFKDKDNFFLEAVSAETTFVEPEKLRHYTYTDKLQPNKKYFYRVGSMKENKWSRWGYFQTDDNDNVFDFFHITDSQAETPKEFNEVQRSLDKAYSVLGVPEFIVSTGDQVELGMNADLWDMFFGSLSEHLLKTTIVPVSGNHEFLATSVSSNFYLNTPTSRIFYSYEYGNALFMVLDTNDLTYDSQLAWAEEILQNSDKQWKIVAFHKAPFSSGTHADDSEVKKIRNRIVPFLAQNGVDLVLNGHDHVYSRTYPITAQKTIAGQENKTLDQTEAGYTKYIYQKPQGAIYVINRCIGVKFYSKSNTLNDHLIEVGDQSKIALPVFSQVKIDNNKLTYTAYEYDRNNTEEVDVLDCFEIVK